GREPLRIQVGKGIPLDRTAEVPERGVAHAGQGERRAQIGVCLQALLLGDVGGPTRGHDPPQQRQRALDLELLVQILRLPQQGCGLGLGRERLGRCHEQCHAQGEASHCCGSRPRNAIRPSDIVPPDSTTTMVSKLLYPGARTSSRLAPTASARSNTLPTPTRRPSTRISASLGLVSIRSLPLGAAALGSVARLVSRRLDAGALLAWREAGGGAAVGLSFASPRRAASRIAPRASPRRSRPEMASMAGTGSRLPRGGAGVSGTVGLSGSGGRPRVGTFAMPVPCTSCLSTPSLSRRSASENGRASSAARMSRVVGERGVGLFWSDRLCVSQ